jgi:hypothetical protein
MANMPTLRDILNGDPGDATDVEFNFNTIETHIDNELIARDGTVSMSAALVLSGTPTLDNHAARKKYVDDQIDTVEASVTALSGLSIFGRVADVSVGLGGYYVVWDTEYVDNDGWGATGSSTLTCPATGLYSITYSSSPWPDGTGGGVYGGLSLAGTFSTNFAYNSTSGGAIPAGVYYMAAGATVQLNLYTLTDISANVSEANIYIARLR